MDIQLENIGKRFRRDWIFRKLNFHIPKGTKLSITGANGSGKSTLVQVISAYLRPTEGNVIFKVNDDEVSSEAVFKYLSYSAPYMTLPDDLTLIECVNFHVRFKPLLKGVNNDDLIRLCYLEKHTTKPVSNFSSGMIQRLKIALTVLSDVPLILLDEPTTNLDNEGIQWYQGLVEKYAGDRTVIVCTNRPEEEAGFCQKNLTISDYQ